MNAEHFLETLQVNENDVRRINSAPQRSKDWFEARESRITGSRIGACIGLSGYQTPDAVLHEMLWGSTFKGNAATRRGTEMEPYAAKALLKKLRAENKEQVDLAVPGLIVCQKEPIFAYSPDGIVLYKSSSSKDLVEIKTPFNRKPYDLIPKSYFCQVQLGMYVLGLNRCLFVQYLGEGREDETEECIKVVVIPRNEKFITQRLLPEARKFYFNRFVPMKLQQFNKSSESKPLSLFPLRSCTLSK